MKKKWFLFFLFFLTLEQTNLSTSISEIEAWKVNE